MQQLGDEVEGAALAALVASGAGEAVQTAVASTGAAVQRGLGQATESVSVREHLFQTEVSTCCRTQHWQSRFR